MLNRPSQIPDRPEFHFGVRHNNEYSIFTRLVILSHSPSAMTFWTLRRYTTSLGSTSSKIFSLNSSKTFLSSSYAMATENDWKFQVIPPRVYFRTVSVGWETFVRASSVRQWAERRSFGQSKLLTHLITTKQMGTVCYSSTKAVVSDFWFL